MNLINQVRANSARSVTVAGVDIGQVKPYSAVLMDMTLNEQNVVESAKLASRELVCSKGNQKD